MLFKTDIDVYYDKDGSILDFYSELPFGKDPYVYKDRSKFGKHADQESESFNREHIIPQSLFNKKEPMRSDFFHVIFADSFVNWRRGSLPFGIVSNPEWVSMNGSKLGANSYGPYKGLVFEPIDEFKGDIARKHFYMATRYENRIKSWRSSPMFNKTNDQVFKDWYLEILLKWHKEDPPSVYEKNRIEDGMFFQGNRNPFIDHPEYAERIWKK